MADIFVFSAKILLSTKSLTQHPNAPLAHYEKMKISLFCLIPQIRINRNQYVKRSITPRRQDRQKILFIIKTTHLKQNIML